MTSTLEVKKVETNGILVLCCQDEDKNIYVGVRSICDSLGIDYSSQLKRISRDELLCDGVVKMTIPSDGGEQITNVIFIDYLPFFLIGIKSTMVKPELKDKILKFKLKAKDILAAAFLPQELSSNPYGAVMYNINENQRFLIAEQSKLNDKITNHLNTYYTDKEVSDNIQLKIGYEIEELKKDVQREIMERTSYIPLKPILAKKMNTVNRARFKVLDKYTNNLRDKKVAEDFINRINILADDIMKWTITQIKDEAERTYSFISGDNAFAHDLCLYTYTYYKGLKTA